MLKEAVVAYLKYYPSGTEEFKKLTESLSQDFRFPGGGSS
jgi:hypothetical protein